MSAITVKTLQSEKAKPGEIKKTNCCHLSGARTVPGRGTRLIRCTLRWVLPLQRPHATPASENKNKHTLISTQPTSESREVMYVFMSSAIELLSHLLLADLAYGIRDCVSIVVPSPIEASLEHSVLGGVFDVARDSHLPGLMGGSIQC